MYSVKNKILKNFPQNSPKNTCVGFYFLLKLKLQTCNFIEKETATRVFFCEFCEIFKKPFFRTIPVAVSPHRVFEIKANIWFIIKESYFVFQKNIWYNSRNILSIIKERF